jgi:hypothetical protein
LILYRSIFGPTTSHHFLQYSARLTLVFTLLNGDDHC